MIQNPTPQAPINRYMSVADFALYGTEDVAYVKPVIVDGEALFGIYAADGQHLAFIEGRDLADATVRQNDMEPLSVH
ncbi:MAG: DUF1150 family protein [Rhodospirillaceae bacterium]|nr:DUF1150 family protein [Rhodospirillaceae bacterium]MBL6930813.1 DUF1150 family protein [Rhodospirillales bacterium]MBL6941310.1 DUF1150 family protein [Rhodospirillales bacterium]